MSRRDGFTLIEMAASISVGSVLLVLALGMVHRTMRIDSTLRKNASTERAASRLARQFRQDIHQAESVSLDLQSANEPVLRVAMSGEPPIYYRVDQSCVHRTWAESDTQVHREQYLFPESCAVHLEELSAKHLAVISIESETGLVGIRPRMVLRVEAVVGLFQQLRNSPERLP